MSGGDAEEDGVQLETRDSPGDAAGCKAGWDDVVARAGLEGTYEVSVRQVRLPDSRYNRARFTFGVYLRVRDGVTPGAAADAALRAAVRAGMAVRP